MVILLTGYNKISAEDKALLIKLVPKKHNGCLVTVRRIF